MKQFLFVIALLLLQGCEKKAEIYSRFLKQEAVTPSCVSVELGAPYAPALANVLEGTGFTYRESCPFRVEMFKSFSMCPPGKNPGAARGFMRLELQHSGQTIYQVQREFFDEEDKELMLFLAARMARELKASRAPQ